MDQTRSEVLTVENEGGTFTGLYAQSGASAPRVLVYHAWWGLTPFFHDFTRRLAGAGFSVFAPDLYDGKTAGTVDEAQAMMEQRDFDRHKFIASSAIEWMQKQPSNSSGLGLVGFSMGGSWSTALAGMYPEAVKAVVLFYGAGDADWANVRARFQGHFGGKDEWTPKEEMETMEAVLRPNGIQYEFFTYPEAQHWFFETNRPEYREQDSALAWERMVKFLKENLT